MNIHQINRNLFGHFAPVHCLLLLKDNRIASSSADSTIKIFNFSSSKCELSLQGHQSTVTFLSQLTNNNLLISCSHDKSIKIWSITSNSYKCEHTIEDAHSDVINKVIQLSFNRMASCSWDHHIKIWRTDSYELIHDIEGHSDNINSIIQLENKEILISLSSGFDKTMKIWSLVTYQCITAIQGIDCWSRHSLQQLSEDMIIIGGTEVITLFNVNQLRTIKTFKIEKINYVYSIIDIDTNTIICGCDCGRLVIINLSTGAIDIKCSQNKQNIYSLMKYDYKHILSGSSGSAINIWEYSIN